MVTVFPRHIDMVIPRSLTHTRTQSIHTFTPEQHRLRRKIPRQSVSIQACQGMRCAWKFECLEYKLVAWLFSIWLDGMTPTNSWVSHVLDSITLTGRERWG